MRASSVSWVRSARIWKRWNAQGLNRKTGELQGRIAIGEDKLSSPSIYFRWSPDYEYRTGNIYPAGDHRPDDWRLPGADRSRLYDGLWHHRTDQLRSWRPFCLWIFHVVDAVQVDQPATPAARVELNCPAAGHIRCD